MDHYRLVARILVCWLVLVLSGSQDGSAQPGSVVKLHRVEGIRIDGLSFEPSWEAIEPLPVVQYEPDPGKPPTERTEIRVGYDRQALYLSLRAFDRDRRGIRSNTLYRDRLSGDDHFEIMLDTYNDYETAVVFTTTPAGIRREGAIVNDASGDNLSWLNLNFNTYWDVETVVNDSGWFAEMRIPFSSLRFQDVDGRVTMGLSVQRKIARHSERLVFPAVAPNINFGFLRPSLGQRIEMEGVYRTNPVYVTAYGLGGVSGSSVFRNTESRYVFEDSFKHEGGLDVKYGLTNNLTLDLTANTDFAQVEADDQQINLTRFPLFFPEKRQFFQERAGLFEFSPGGGDLLFHSRRIGLTDAGQPVRILGGARMVGRIGQWDVGFLDMQTANGRYVDSENFGVVRFKRKMFNEYSFLGGMLTTRASPDIANNVAYGVDGVFRIKNEDYLLWNWSQTFEANRSARGLNSGRLNIGMERRKREGFGYDGEFTWSGRQYHPGIGFVRRTNYSELNTEFSFTWLPTGKTKLLYHTIEMDAVILARNTDKNVESVEIGPGWEFGTRPGSSGRIDASLLYEDLPFGFYLSDKAEVPAGQYTFYRVTLSGSMPRTALRQAGADLAVGSFYDGWQFSTGITPTWYVSPHLELTGRYEFNRIVFPDRDQEFVAHIARIRIGTALNRTISTNAFVQYSSEGKTISTNVRFRWNFREGNDLWIVYNEGLNTDRRRFSPTLPITGDRAVLVKYTHTLAF